MGNSGFLGTSKNPYTMFFSSFLLLADIKHAVINTHIHISLNIDASLSLNRSFKMGLLDQRLYAYLILIGIIVFNSLPSTSNI